MENRRLERAAPRFGLAGAVKELLANPVFYRALGYAARTVMGFLLARAVILGNLAPFGVGLAAAAGGGLGGLLAAVGALGGYLLSWDDVDSIKYIAILVIVYSSGFVFRGSKFSKHIFFMPTAAAISAAFVGGVILAGEGFGLTSVLVFLTDTLMMAGSAYFYSVALSGQDSEGRLRRSVSQLVLSATLFMSLSGWVVLGQLHPARFAASLFVLLSAYRGGAGVGSASGLAIGLTMDMALGRAYFSMAYGISGLLAGVFKKRGKLLAAVIYVVAGGATALWADSPSLRVAVLIETFVASTAFMLIPDKSSARAIEGLEEEPDARNDGAKRSQSFARRRLENTSSAFRELYNSLQNAFEGVDSRNDNDIFTVFDQTAEKVCRRCAMRGVCWDRDASMTRQVFSDASARLGKRGRAESGDFPAHFASRCVQFGKFLASINEEMNALLIRRQYKSRLSENRTQICRQYSEMSRILEHVAGEVGQGITFDDRAEQRLQRYLKGSRLDLKGMVYKDAAGRRWVEIEGNEAGRLLEMERANMLRQVGMCAGFPVSQPEYAVNPHCARLLFGEAECYSATLGVASHKKKGEEISGDSGTYFKTPDGKLFILLSDGMGSGMEAAVGSSQAIKLLERFLRAGIQPEIALETLNSALVLREEGGFVTVDLLICDLLSGETRFFKNGASPTYIKKGEKVKRVSGKALPSGMGLGGNGAPDMTSIQLNSGDVCVMVSDGVTGTEGGEWLIPALQGCGQETPKDLAAEVLRQAVLREGRCDDMTVIALKVHKRKDAELE